MNGHYNGSLGFMLISSAIVSREKKNKLFCTRFCARYSDIGCNKSKEWCNYETRELHQLTEANHLKEILHCSFCFSKFQSLIIKLNPYLYMPGDPNLHPILVTVQSRLGLIPLVHIEDICNAQIFLMENNAAEGRYICSASSSTIPRLEKLLVLPFFQS